ncbi:MAG: hypothetical protein ABIR39_00840 [Nocardioides sp.]
MDRFDLLEVLLEHPQNFARAALLEGALQHVRATHVRDAEESRRMLMRPQAPVS